MPLIVVVPKVLEPLGLHACSRLRQARIEDAVTAAFSVNVPLTTFTVRDTSLMKFVRTARTYRSR